MTPGATAVAGVPAPAWQAYWDALAGGDSAAAVRVALGMRADGAALVDVLDGLVVTGQSEVGRL